ncbi:MAG: RNA 2',3'-cyclic phosphodiesterase [Myxococcales bacterium]
MTDRAGETDSARSQGRRSFIAVALPAALRCELFAAAAALAPPLPGVKWALKVENLHLTLKFLGKVSDENLAKLAAALVEELAAVPPFEVTVRGMGAFPRPSQANVIWAGVDDATGGLARVAELVETIGARLQLGEKEARPYRAHITVGRAKPDRDVRAALAPWADRAFGTFTVATVQLYESKLSPHGSTHLVLASARLGWPLSPPPLPAT